MSKNQETDTTAAGHQSNRKVRVGRVVSDAMEKTVVVEVVARVPHPKFGKIIKQSKKFYVHDEDNQAKIGDIVRITETRPISKHKCWNLVEIQSHDPEVMADEQEQQAVAAGASEEPPAQAE